MHSTLKRRHVPSYRKITLKNHAELSYSRHSLNLLTIAPANPCYTRANLHPPNQPLTSKQHSQRTSFRGTYLRAVLFAGYSLFVWVILYLVPRWRRYRKYRQFSLVLFRWWRQWLFRCNRREWDLRLLCLPIFLFWLLVIDSRQHRWREILRFLRGFFLHFFVHFRWLPE